MDIPPKNNTEDEIKESAKREALEKLKQKAVIVNINEIAEGEARKAADAYMTESARKLQADPSTKKTKVGRVIESIGNNFNSKDAIKKTITRIWKHTFFDEYYRQREVSRVRNEIYNSDNIYAGRIGENKVAHESAMQAITERFTSEYEGTLSEGENKEILDDNKPEQVKIKTDIKNLLNEYAKGNLSEEAFRNQKVRILDGLNNENENKSKKSFNNYADNLLELAQNARLAISHGAKIEELDYDLDAIVGNAKSSLKTEAHFNKVDKCIDKMKKSKIGRFVSPAVLNTSIGIAYSLSVLLTKKAAGLTSSIIPLLGSVAVSSAFTGMNESQRLALERAQHGIEMAEGGEFEEGSKKREQMEKFAYQMESSNDLASRLRELMFDKGEDGKEILKDIKQEDLEKIFANLANIDARKSLNASKKIDLISYSGIGNVEKESTDLTILVARAKAELRKKIEGDLKKGIPEGKTFDEYLAEQTQTVSDSLLGGEKGITAQDKAFKTFKTKEVAKKVLKTATFGFIAGATLQEAMAFGNDNVQGTFEGIFHHDANATIQTPIDHIKDWITGHPTHMGMNNAVETILSDGHHVLLPNGTSILENPDGTFDILRGGNVISDNIDLNFDANGNLDSDSLARLGEAGIVGNTIHNVVDGTEEINNNAEGYVNNHSGSVHNIARDGWYDNDTPKPIFDQNELKLQWGGEAGSEGIDADGNYVFDVSHMTSDGSFHQEFSMDAQEAIKNGGLKIIFSLTEGTQSHVFEIPIDIHGNAIIDPDSEIGKLFFGTENGHAVFKGRFAEVVQSFGDKDGVEHVKSLATLVGPGNDSIKDVIPTHIDVPVTNLDVPVGVQPPLYVPIMSRRPLESLKKKEDIQPIYYFGGSGFEPSKEQIERHKYDKSKTLTENPNATLDQYYEISEYLSRQDKNYLESLKKMSEEMGPMDEGCRLSVCIPVAGHQEGETIYESLKNYSSQTISNDKFEIVLFVNRPDKDNKGNVIKPDNTLEEIKRFKKDYPNMNIRILERVLPIKDARIGYIRKVINDAVVLRQYNRGKDAPELFIVSNDADNKGMAPQYIENFISKFDNNKDVDSMIGQLDWDPESYIRNPLIHIGTRLFQYEGAQSRFNGWHFNSSGANFAFRSSIYAAVGGYSGDLPKGGEDTDFGAKITEARLGAQDKKPIIYAGSRSSRLYTSSRRAEMVMKNYGLAPMEQWDKGFSAFDDEVRKVNWESKEGKINYNNPEEVHKLISSLETVINRTISRSKEWGASTRDESLARSLGWLGVKYEITGDHSIKITDASKLIEGLEQYQKEGLDLLKKKTTIIKNKKEKERLDKEKLEIKNELATFMNKFPDSDQKIKALNILLDKSLNNDTLKRLGLNISIEGMSEKVNGLKNINNNEEFNNGVQIILAPVIDALQNNPKESMIFQRKAFIASHEFIPVNEIFSYGIYNGDLHLHLAPASDLTISEKMRLLKDALPKLAKIVASNSEVKNVTATSWIVASNPGLLKKLGFKIEGPVDEETKNRDFAKEIREVDKAIISREEFLLKYNK